MENKKKIILGISIIIAIVVIGMVVFFVWKGTTQQNEETAEDKVTKLYQQIVENQTYTFTRTLDNENQIMIVRNQDKGYKEQKQKGNTDRYVVKDNSTYLLQDKTKKYYKYQNNTSILTELSLALEELQESEKETGKEKINGKNYTFESYQNYDSLSLRTLSEQEDNSPITKFYFEGNNLKYIKTIIGDQEELLKVQLTFNAKNELLEIPSDFQDAEK